jgi:hypothetical protein
MGLEIKQLENRLCPDIAKDDPNYQIKNLYQNKNERRSFSIQIFKCKNEDCYEDDEIERFLKKTQFNQQLIEGSISFIDFNDIDDDSVLD